VAKTKNPKKDEGLPVAIATHGGLLATLIVLLVGTVNGTRAWIVLLKSTMAFLLASSLLRLLTAAALQSIRWKATPPRPRGPQDPEVSPAAAGSPESMEIPAS
jgi:hypothetical protein